MKFQRERGARTLIPGVIELVHPNQQQEAKLLLDETTRLFAPYPEPIDEAVRAYEERYVILTGSERFGLVLQYGVSRSQKGVLSKKESGKLSVYTLEWVIRNSGLSTQLVTIKGKIESAQRPLYFGTYEKFKAVRNEILDKIR